MFPRSVFTCQLWFFAFTLSRTLALRLSTFRLIRSFWLRSLLLPTSWLSLWLRGSWLRRRLRSSWLRDALASWLLLSLLLLNRRRRLSHRTISPRSLLLLTAIGRLLPLLLLNRSLLSHRTISLRGLFLLLATIRSLRLDRSLRLLFNRFSRSSV